MEIRKNLFSPPFDSLHPSNQCRRQITWDSKKVNLLIAAVLKHSAHLDGGKKMHEKWRSVYNDLYQHKDFSSHREENSFNASSVQAKFKSLIKSIKDKYALEKEGANLSGLQEVNDVDSLLIDIAKDQMMSKQEKIENEEKKNNSKRKLLVHEEQILKSQSNSVYDDDDNDYESEVITIPDSPSTLTHSSPSPSKKKSRTKSVDNGMQEISRYIREFEEKNSPLIQKQIEEREISIEEKKLNIQLLRNQLNSSTNTTSNERLDQIEESLKEMKGQFANLEKLLNTVISKMN